MTDLELLQEFCTRLGDGRIKSALIYQRTSPDPVTLVEFNVLGEDGFVMWGFQETIRPRGAS